MPWLQRFTGGGVQADESDEEEIDEEPPQFQFNVPQKATVRQQRVVVPSVPRKAKAVQARPILKPAVTAVRPADTNGPKLLPRHEVEVEEILSEDGEEFFEENDDPNFTPL